MSATQVWYLLIDQQMNAVRSPDTVYIPPGDHVGDLMMKIEENSSRKHDNVDALALKLWKLRSPLDVDGLMNSRKALNEFLSKICLLLGDEAGENEAQALHPLDAILELGAWPQEKLHVIVQLPITVWYISINHQKIPFDELCRVNIPSDVNTTFLMERIKEQHPERVGPRQLLEMWKLSNPPSTESLYLKKVGEFLRKIQNSPHKSDENDENEVILLGPGDVISEVGAWPQKKLHMIVQFPAPADLTCENLQTIEPDGYPREIVIALPNSIRSTRFLDDHLDDNQIYRISLSSQRFKKIEDHLRRKRYIDEPDLSVLCRLSPFQGLSRYFESNVPAETHPWEHVTDNELGHYISTFASWALLQTSVFIEAKGNHIYALLCNLLEPRQSSSSKCYFGENIPFHLVVKTASEAFMYTPRPDFHTCTQGFPRVLLKIASQLDLSELYWMLSQASCLARFGNRISRSKEPVVIMAIYVDHFFRAHRYLVSASIEPDSDVQYTWEEFPLTEREPAFKFIFELYNFISAAETDVDNLDDPESAIAAVKQSVAKKGYKAFTTTICSGTSSSGANPGAAHDSLSNPLVQKDLAVAGYTLTQYPEDLKPLTPLKPTMGRATSRMGVSVVLKMIRDSNERVLLQHLNAIKMQSNHTISLLEVIELNIGKTVIVLPLRLPLEEVLGFRDYPSDVLSLCAQFIEGVAFLHQHKVAHCDLKPSNVVVGAKKDAKTPPPLFIIDFDIAQFVESEETMVLEGWCGTPPWVAPELGLIDGPIQAYSPILADRWACGLMIQHFAKYMPRHVNKQVFLAFAQRLLDINPRARPPLDQLRGSRKRVLENSEHEDEPLQKRAVN